LRTASNRASQAAGVLNRKGHMLAKDSCREAVAISGCLTFLWIIGHIGAGLKFAPRGFWPNIPFRGRDPHGRPLPFEHSPRFAPDPNEVELTPAFHHDYRASVRGGPDR
jgi:hypothetical protein